MRTQNRTFPVPNTRGTVFYSSNECSLQGEPYIAKILTTRRKSEGIQICSVYFIYLFTELDNKL